MTGNQIRRTILSVLVESRQMPRDELASELASDDAIAVTDTSTLEISLHHNHLPKLSAEQYIEYDPRSGDVILWKEPAAVRDELEETDSRKPGWCGGPSETRNGSESP